MTGWNEKEISRIYDADFMQAPGKQRGRGMLSSSSDSSQYSKHHFLWPMQLSNYGLLKKKDKV